MRATHVVVARSASSPSIAIRPGSRRALGRIAPSLIALAAHGQIGYGAARASKRNSVPYIGTRADRVSRRERTPSADDGLQSTSLGKGLSLLTVLSLADEPLGLSEIARRSGYTKSTTFRLLGVLTAFGAVDRRADGTYEIGLRLFELGRHGAARRAFQSSALEELERLRDQTNETSHLAIRIDDEIMYLEVVESTNAIKMSSAIGRRNPLYCTALGKALLAFGDRESAEGYIERHSLVAHTKYTVTDRGALRRQLDEIGRQGYAVDNQELELELTCIAVPVLVQDQAVAAVSVSGPVRRFDRQRWPEIAAAATETARRIGLMFEAHGSPFPTTLSDIATMPGQPARPATSPA